MYKRQDLICKALHQQHGVQLNVEHVFSCEIEPFKQAYIERNFAPPLLFRDIRELGDEEATTAYGATRPVPGEVDRHGGVNSVSSHLLL